MKVDMDAVRLLMEEAARTTILPHFRKLESKQIDQKAGPHDVVTVADKASEEFLTPRLQALIPGSTVVGAADGAEGSPASGASESAPWQPARTAGTARTSICRYTRASLRRAGTWLM